MAAEVWSWPLRGIFLGLQGKMISTRNCVVGQLWVREPNEK